MKLAQLFRGRSKISGKGVHMYKGGCWWGCGARCVEFISFFLNIPWKWNNLISLRPNYLFFVRYSKTCVCVCVCVCGGGGFNPRTRSGSATVIDIFSNYRRTELFKSILTDLQTEKIFSEFLIQNICCGYSKEPPQWNGSFEPPKHMFN